MSAWEISYDSFAGPYPAPVWGGYFVVRRPDVATRMPPLSDSSHDDDQAVRLLRPPVRSTLHARGGARVRVPRAQCRRTIQRTDAGGRDPLRRAAVAGGAPRWRDRDAHGFDPPSRRRAAGMERYGVHAGGAG